MKKWMLVVALVIGILIGSLVGNPFKGEAGIFSEIEFVGQRNLCFVVFRDSITFVQKGRCP
ncbi:MAG: hypothetical protein ACE5G9_10060 [Nitrospinales bacterium]